MIISRHPTGPKAELGPEEEKKADLSGASLESDSSAVMQETSDDAVHTIVRQEGEWLSRSGLIYTTDCRDCFR